MLNRELKLTINVTRAGLNRELTQYRLVGRSSWFIWAPSWFIDEPLIVPQRATCRCRR